MNILPLKHILLGPHAKPPLQKKVSQNRSADDGASMSSVEEELFAINASKFNSHIVKAV